MRCAVLAVGLCLLAATVQADSLSRRLADRCAATVSTFVRGALFAAEVSGRKLQAGCWTQPAARSSTCVRVQTTSGI